MIHDFHNVAQFAEAMDDSGSSGTGRSLTSVTFDRLRSDVLGGELRPSERLRIQHLCERYDVGATVVREALSRLVTEGLVESEDQRGFCVAPVSRSELIDLTETRVRIEQSAIRIAIAKGDIEWETTVLASFHRLSRLSAPSVEAKTARAWIAAHRQFHFALIEGCGSPWTLKLCSMLYDQTERYRSLSGLTAGNKTRDVLKEHRHLLDAVVSRDADRACTLIARHFQRTTDLILAAGIVKELGQGMPPVRRRAVSS